jgi:hypothetical protein
MKDQMLTRLLDGLVWGGVPDQQGLMDTVKKHTSKGILRQIASLCAGTPSTEQAYWILYWELFFNTCARGLELDEGDVNQMCTWDNTALGRDFWEFIHTHGDRL